MAFEQGIGWGASLFRGQLVAWGGEVGEGKEIPIRDV